MVAWLLLAALAGETVMAARQGKPGGGGGGKKPTTPTLTASCDWALSGFNMFYVSHAWSNCRPYVVTIEAVDDFYGASAGLAGQAIWNYGGAYSAYSYPYAPVYRPASFPYGIDPSHHYTITVKLLDATNKLIIQTVCHFEPATPPPA